MFLSATGCVRSGELTGSFAHRQMRVYFVLCTRAHSTSPTHPNAVDCRDFWTAGACRLVAELCKIFSPMLVREVVLHVQGQSAVTESHPIGGVALAIILFLVVVLQACTLQHFIHGGEFPHRSIRKL